MCFLKDSRESAALLGWQTSRFSVRWCGARLDKEEAESCEDPGSTEVSRVLETMPVDDFFSSLLLELAPGWVEEEAAISLGWRMEALSAVLIMPSFDDSSTASLG